MNVGVVLKRELSGYFATPVAYVFIFIFLLLIQLLKLEPEAESRESFHH